MASDRTQPAGDAGARPGPDAGSPTDDDAAAAARILVVDDNEDCRLALRSFLEASGYEVYEAADGEAAVEGARRLRPDLILMDVMMPGVDGLEATRSIRAEADLDGVRIVAISAMEGARQATLDAGCDACVLKPLDMSRFPGLVEDWLSGA